MIVDDAQHSQSPPLRSPPTHPSVYNVPNALSATRLLLAPVLLVLAYVHVPRLFLALLIVSLVTDILDGKIARLLNQGSQLGAKLDSWADFATYMSIPLCAWWLRPDVVRSEALVFWVAVGAWTLPVALGFVKFRALTSYHTKNAVIAAYALGAATVVMFAEGPLWPLRVATVVLVIAGVEEIAITAVLQRPITNVASLRRALSLRDRDRA